MADYSKKKTEVHGQGKKVQQGQQKVERTLQEKREIGDIPLLRFGVARNNFLKFKMRACEISRGVFHIALRALHLR
jgi:hypothetical protein